jgi:putative nucleotidyltransferase with HDIG domain
MEVYKMPENIRAHSMVVEKVAAVLARGLREVGVDISLDRVAAGALMHDIGKPLCLRSGGDHARKGEEICLRHHLDEIADIVAEHVRLKRYDSDSAIGEKEIIYYSDKRVNHDKVVSLEDRLDYILKRYGKNQEHLGRRIKDNFRICRILEKEIFSHLRFGPQDLEQLIKALEPHG